jgi:hypothetical protein
MQTMTHLLATVLVLSGAATAYGGAPHAAEVIPE